MDKKELFNEFLQRVRPCASITDDMLDEILHLRQQLTTEKIEFEQCSDMLTNAERYIETLEQQLAVVEKERNAFQDQCIRLKHERVLEKEQLASAIRELKGTL